MFPLMVIQSEDTPTMQSDQTLSKNLIPWWDLSLRASGFWEDYQIILFSLLYAGISIESLAVISVVVTLFYLSERVPGVIAF